MKKRIFAGLFALLLLPALCGCAKKAKLTLAVPAIGQADCILLSDGAHTAVIDLGEDDDGAEIIENLRGLGVQKIDCLIVTHFDKDHIGGAAEVLSAFPVERALLPAYEKDSKLYRRLLAALSAQGVTPEFLSSDTTFALGDMMFAVDVSKTANIGTSDNDSSLVTTLTYGEKRFLFAADAEAARTAELLDAGNIACDVLKVPHHGRYNERTAELLAAASPAYAIITDSDKNPAEDEVLALLKKQGAETFQTRDGDVRIVTNGEQLAAHQS